MIQDQSKSKHLFARLGVLSSITLDHNKEWQCSDHWKAGEGYPWDRSIQVEIVD